MKEIKYVSEHVLDRNTEFEIWKNFYRFAKILERRSKKGFFYTVDETYLDLGLDWKWTTVICLMPDGNTFQALNPKQWSILYHCETMEDLEKLADEYFAGKFCLDIQ